MTTTISSSAFNGCSNLTTISLPPSLTNIKSYAFYGCSSLTSINLPEGLTYNGDNVFDGCSSLTTISLPPSLTNISSSAFSGCSALTNISLPKGLTNIKSYAFYGCSSLTSINLPEGLTYIGDNVFDGCSSLETIIIDGDENKVERVKKLLPEEHRDKVISKPLAEEVLLAQKEEIMELAATPQFSSLYKWHAYLKPILPNSILGKINSYLTDDESLHPLFHMGRQEIERIPLSLFFTNPERFCSKLVEVKNNYRALAEEKIKPSIKWQFYDTKNETPMREEETYAAVTKPYN